MFFASALNELMTERPPSFGGVARIPGSAIREYAQHLGLTLVWADVFYSIMRRVDTAIIEHYESKSKSKRKNPSK